MGCHTWFHKRVYRSYTVAKRKYIQREKWWINEMEKYDRGDTDTVLDWVDMLHQYNTTPKKQIRISKRKIRMVKKGLCRLAVCNNQEDLTFANGKFYTHDDVPFHDIFRIGGYPEDKLFSYEETVYFIERNKDGIYSWLGWIDGVNTFGNYDNMIETWKIKLKEYWDTYPTGMISFG